MDIILQFGLLVAGFFMLGKGADWFVEGAASIATRFGIPQLVIGLTIVAMGTSAPEAAVSLAAALKGSADITIGNVVGSNIMNVLIILGISAVITRLKVAKSTIKIEIPFMIAVTAMLYLQGLDGVITLMDGALLAAVFIAYLLYLYIVTRQADPTEETEDIAGYPLGQALLWSGAGMALIMVGSNVTVGAATQLAQFAGLSERFIGLTIVALGTSLPELFTSVTAARKGNADIAIGNVLGSNIVNIEEDYYSRYSDYKVMLLTGDELNKYYSGFEKNLVMERESKYVLFFSIAYPKKASIFQSGISSLASILVWVVFSKSFFHT